MIPQRFQANCTFCSDPLDIRRPGVYQLASGWVKNRKEGGANALHLPERQLHWACEFCMDAKLKGQARYQLNLFG